MSAVLAYLADPADAERYSTSYSYPTTTSGWKTRYEQLRRIYLVGDYSTAEREYWKLFEARDTDDKKIDWTRRFFSIGAFLVNTDARALTGGRALLELPRGVTSGALLTAGEAIWRRSSMALQLPMAAKMTACLGDYWVEAVRTKRTKPYGTTLCFYAPELVTPVYDDANPTIVRSVVIEYASVPADAYAAGSNDASDYVKRTITETGVTVEINGRVDESYSGEHRSGVCPVAHLQWMPFDTYEHSLSAMHGLDVPLMHLDSAMCQSGAALTRFGNPVLVITGARSAEPADIGRLGRMLFLPNDKASAAYLETARSMIGDSLDRIKAVMDHLRETRPEFLFANSGAGESGAARSFLAAAFSSQINEVRGHWFDALQQITGIAVAMDANEPYDLEKHAFAIDAPPPLPVDVVGEVDALYKASADLKREDRVRRLQTLGLLDPSHDPVKYAAEIDAGNAAMARTVLGPFGEGTGGAPVDTGRA